MGAGRGEDSWTTHLRKSEDACARLLCFAPAGATAMFFSHIARAMPRSLSVDAVQYAGRQDRRREPPVLTITELADSVVSSLPTGSATPLVLFGHGMGALVAFETAVRLRRRGAEPLALVASGTPAPSLPRPAEPNHVLFHDATDVSQAARDGDDTAFRTYRWDNREKLACHVLAMVGGHDPSAPVEDVLRWGEVTSGSFELQVFSGDHFYLRVFVSTVANAVSERVIALCEGRYD
ncbi:thioesterase domain-containing protein [Actinosynnema sp. NPDC051121]